MLEPKKDEENALKIEIFKVGPLATNCYLLTDKKTNKMAIIDPGGISSKLDEKLTQGGKCEYIILTHGHFDHIWGVEELRERSGAEVYAYEGEEKLCQDPALNVSAAVGRSCGITPDHLFRDGEEFEFAGIRGRVIATPGHTGGSCCYYFEEDQILISGDTLFQESVGRTDFPTGSMSALVRSVKEKLFTLPDETRVYPGHGMMTTIGYEKENNAFV